MFTNRTGCNPCEEIDNLRRNIGGHLGNLHNGVNNIESTLTTHKSNINELYSMFKDTDPTLTYTYHERGAFRGGPISVEFYMATVGDSSSATFLGPLIKFKIDNNGKGYISLTDLFQTDISNLPQGHAPNDLNGKIRELIVESNIGTKDYFKNSNKSGGAGKESVQDVECYTISELTIKFDSGQSYVREPRQQNFQGLGDAWGPPVFFEIGGNHYLNDGKSYTPNTAVPFKVKGATSDINEYTVQIQSVRIIGDGQGSTTIRGSCIFVIYNMIDTGIQFEGSTAWPSKPSFLTFSNRRIVSGGYLWAGHFGICTNNDDLSGNFMGDPEPYEIGVVPLPTSVGAKIYIPNYQGASGENLPKGKSIEYLFIDAWIELEENTFAGILKSTIIGYPVLTIGAIIPKRFYVKNVVCFSYQTMNPESKGLVCINSSYIHSVTRAPIDTFIENCTFAARNFNSSVGTPTPTARSLVIRNADKLSLMTSTFHGNMDLNVNKLAAYNCYCLAVGDTANGTDLVNYNMVISQPATTKASGYHGIATNSRIILQNMIYVTHLDGSGINTALKTPPTAPVTTLTGLSTHLLSPTYRYDTSMSLYPIKNTFSTENIFISNSTYYGVMTLPQHPPTFSVLNLNTENIIPLTVPVMKPSQLGNVL